MVPTTPSSPDLDHEYLTVDEAAAILRVHPVTVRSMFKSGELPGFKAGREWRISKSALAGWADARTVA
jgi:excisionase family DNA binding protein